ncbi:MAG TPA: universal stress protein [Gammaproteobacteria bacterium]|nr:universal stress protein [Gammaproteobacteria bacterium]
MNYASLLVHVGQAVYRNALIEVGLKLTETFNAHLTALHIYSPVHYAYGGLGTWSAMEALLRDEEEAARQRDVAFKAKFESQARRFEALRSEWRYESGELIRTLAQHARYVDLLVMGQHNPDEASLGAYDKPVEVALMAGRPVLVAPYAWRSEVVGRRIVVAWNATRESTRAANAALPLLIRAASVDIVVVGEDKQFSTGYGEGPGSDIALYLARHGIKSSVSRIPREEWSVSEVLLSIIADRGADLLCMGAYGHSRLRELILGGVTHDLMHHMTVPTLIAC